MSVFLTPDLKPFIGGTYFPPEDGLGRPGFVTILNTIHKQVSISLYKAIVLVKKFFPLKVDKRSRPN